MSIDPVSIDPAGIDPAGIDPGRDLALTAPDDDEVTLHLDLAGGGLRSLRVRGWDVLAGYPEGTEPHGRRGHVLAPWPNRLPGGAYSWDGRELSLTPTDPGTGAAIHGLVDRLHWSVLGSVLGSVPGSVPGEMPEVAGSRVSLGVVLEAQPGYPFRLALQTSYALTAHDLLVTVGATNIGADPAPFGVGMHPYFALGADVDATSLELPARSRVPFGPDGSPGGPARPFDGELDPVGDAVLDIAVTDLDRDAAGWAHAYLRGPAGWLTLSVDASWPWLMLFTGDTLPPDERRRSVALEPMSCPPAAFATGTDVARIEPGGSWQGSWRLAWSPAGGG